MAASIAFGQVIVPMNSRIRYLSLRPRTVATIVFLASIVILLGHYAIKYGLNDPPSIRGDEMSYDMVSWNLAKGNGFSEQVNDSIFWEPYVAAGKITPAQARREQLNPVVVTHEGPPLFPYLLSLFNRQFGRQFWSVRIVNVLATSGTAGMLVWYLLRTGNFASAFFGFVCFLIADTRTRVYGRAVLTEATATFLLTIVTILLLLLLQHWRRRTLILLGITVGLLVLDRTIFALWLPGLALLVGRLSYQAPTKKTDVHLPPSRKRALASAFFFLAISGLVLLPWGVRNVLLLKAPMPFGTQGMSQLPAGFSDLALERRGLWSAEPTHRLKRKVAHFSTRQERDVARARLGRQEAIDWIWGHPTDALRLAGMKIWQEYRPRLPGEWFICVMAVVGFLLTLRRSDTRVFMGLHLISCFVIAVTWSVEGRFVMPLMFTTHVFAARPVAILFSNGRGSAS
ncbi:MAG: glycosyltransferase family 39 protein [Fuerstiella sp.]|nr:glycosyltransferase family 39 protein [Fuerstiella sp.]